MSLGVDANGLYITTNEFELLSPGRFRGAQIYAISKRGLVAGGPANVELFDAGATTVLRLWMATRYGLQVNTPRRPAISLPTLPPISLAGIRVERWVTGPHALLM